MQTCKECSNQFPDDMHICPFCGHEVEEDEHRLRFQWHLGSLLGPERRSTPTSPAPAGRDRASVILISVILCALIFANIALAVVLWPRTSPKSTATPTPAQPVLLASPTMLDFGKVEVGKTTFLSLLLKKNDSLPFKKEIMPQTARWSRALLESETRLSNSLREGFYDVLADTGNLQPGEYSTTLPFASSGSVADVIVKVTVVPHNQPQPAHMFLNPSSLNFGIMHPGNQQTLLLTVGNDGGQDLFWSVDLGKSPWLTLDTNNGKLAVGALPRIIKVSVNTASLTLSRMYSTTILFKSNGGNIGIEALLTLSPLSGTPTPINTPISTDTPVVPTDTPVPTNTPIVPTDTPTPTDTPIPTDTPTVPTDTPTPTVEPIF